MSLHMSKDIMIVLRAYCGSCRHGFVMLASRVNNSEVEDVVH